MSNRKRAFSLVLACIVPLLILWGLLLTLNSQAAPAASTEPKPPQPNLLLEAIRQGKYPAQLAGHSGNIRPDRYGPQRNDPAEGIPAHAYSPFDERRNREYPCPSGGCEFQKGQVLVKLAPQVHLRRPDLKGAWTEDAALNEALQTQGVLRLEPVFPNARPPKAGEFVVSPQGERLPKPDLTRWYRAALADEKADVYAVVQALSEAAGVAWAEPDYLRRPAEGPESKAVHPSTSAPPLLGTPTDPLYDQQWHLSATNVPQAWQWLEDNGYTPGGSRDIVVAVIDTGVDYTHPDLAANMWVNATEFSGTPGVDDDGNGYTDDIYGADTVYPDGDPQDDHGHGTHVAGIVAAQAYNNEGGVGVAYNVQLMAIKAAQYSGVLASSDIAEAIYYAVAQGADVINMSFGGYARSQLEEDALAVAFGQAVLVAAAGNDGKVNLPCKFGRDMYPAAYNWVVGVMARAQFPNAKGDYLAGFSNYDCKAQDSHEYELMAPGVDVWSTLPNENYAAWDGTSMATPVVSGIAALVRTKFADKDVYSSRFIMGQLATTGPLMQAYTPLKGPAVSYYVPDAYAALTTFPKPKLSYLEHWLFDTTDQDPNNDDDGIVDAGETVDLAIVIRNHWGKADPVTVTLEAWAEGAFQPDPYVTMITDTVDYGAVGSFNIDDNGFIYEDDVIVGVRHPFRFTVPITTPNDHLIPFRLTMIAGNGLEPSDTTIYTFQSRFYLMVQRGWELPRIIDEDMTLTKDYYYLVPDATLIEEGVVVTVTEGTQVQFWSADPNDPYSQDARPYLQVEGSLLVQGTEDEPVEFFSGAFYPGHVVDIRRGGGMMPGEGTGTVELRYLRLLNPRVQASIIDHSYFAQELFECIYDRNEWGSSCTNPEINAFTITNSIVYKVGSEWGGRLSVSNGNKNLYDSDVMYLSGNAIQDSVFLKNYKLYETQWGDREYWVSEANGPGVAIYEPTFLRTAFPVQYNGKIYVALQKQPDPSWQDNLGFAEWFANQLGGHVVTINDAAENEFLQRYRQNFFSQDNFNQTYPDMDCGDSDCWYLFDGSFVIGLTDRETEGQFEWISGEPVSYTSWGWGEPNNGGCPTCNEDYVQFNWGSWNDISWPDGPIILELPNFVTQAMLSDIAVRLAEEASSLFVRGATPAGAQAADATPFLDLPIAYTDFAQALQGNVHGMGPGLVNAWFDHSSPDYTTDGYVVLWSGAHYTDTETIAQNTCTTGAGCYDGHNGIDFKRSVGDEPIFAAAPGTVISTTTNCQSGIPCGTRYGNQVWIDHQNDYVTLYGHLESISVTIGTVITDTALQPLGIMGNTGDSQGIHLHFGVYYDQNSDSGWTEAEVVDPFGWVGDGTDPWGMPNDYLWLHPIYSQTTVNPGVETTFTSPSGNITVTIPSGVFTSTVDLQLWQTPLAADSSWNSWWGGNARSLGRSFMLRTTTGITMVQNSYHIYVSYIPTDTLHLRENELRLFRLNESENRWYEAGGWVDTNQHRFNAEWIWQPLGHFDLQAPLYCDWDNRYEPNDSYHAATFVYSDNTPYYNVFDLEEDQDWFRFEAVAGSTYLIQTSDLQGSADTILEICDQDGVTLLATDDNSGSGYASRLEWQPPVDGIYFIRITQPPDSPYGCENWPRPSCNLKVFQLLPPDVEVTLAAVRGQIIAEGSFNTFNNNAFLNVWWDPDIDHWMRFDVSAGRGYWRYLTNNWWGTTNTTLIDAAIEDYNDDFNKGRYIYQPMLTQGPESAYPFVADVTISTASEPDATIVGAEPVTFTITFNREMSTTVQPAVSFGPDVPETDYTVHAIEGGWQDARTWAGTFNITPITGDGYQFMRIAGAVAADDPWLVTGDDSERFRFEIITSGTEAMNLQATGGEGYVDLMWTQDDFDLLAGYNLYRATTITGTTYTRINDSILPPDQRTYQDTDVQPGQPYYYKFTVVKTDMTESDFSNVATATPVDTVPPVISHTPVTQAPPGLPLTLFADVTDNVGVQGVTLYFKAIGATSYQSKAMVKTTGNRYSATIEGAKVISPGLEYYIEATDGVSTVRDGRAEYPHQVTVVDRPVVTTVSPNHGPASGGTAVTISGSNFKNGASVTFGGAVAEDATVVSSSQMTCTTPAHYPSTVDVTVTNPDDQSGTLLRGFTYESDVASLSLPNTGGGQHDIVQVPVNAANVQGLAAADLTITFDQAVLSARDASTGNLTPGWSVVANTNTPGEIRVSMASPGGTVSGSGVLTYLEFEVVGSPGASTTLQLTSASLNDGAIPVETADGSFTVSLVYDVAGTVRFWQNSAGVPDVLLTLEGDRVYTGQSDANGAYTVSGAETDDYTLTPSKSDDVNGISAYDASLVLQHSAGLNILTGHAATAADVNKSGAITSMDAFYILQKAVELITLPFPGAGVVWDFDPPSRSYTNLSSDQTGQDFTAVLLGDVSGNWSAELGQALPQATGTASLTLPDLYAEPGERITVTLDMALDQAEVYGADIVVSYDPTVVSAASVSADDAAQDFMTASNLNPPGQVQVAMASAQPITDDGRLLTLVLDVMGKLGDTSPLQITAAELNEGGVIAQWQDGSVSVVDLPDHDFNRDCIVNVADVMRVASRWRCRSQDACYDERYDIDHDGDIDIVDIMKVVANWGATCW